MEIILVHKIIVIDCGIGLLDKQMHGVDLIIPYITYLLENSEKTKYPTNYYGGLK